MRYSYAYGLPASTRLVIALDPSWSDECPILCPYQNVYPRELTATGNGRTARGTLVLSGRGPARKVRLTALGLRPDARAAWLNGTDGKKRYIVNVERLAGKASVRIRIWRDGVLLFRPALVPAKALRLTR